MADTSRNRFLKFVLRKRWYTMIQKTTDRDTTIEDIHRTRERIHDAFNGDLKAMLADARNRQAASGRPVWNPTANDNATAEASGESLTATNREMTNGKQ